MTYPALIITAKCLVAILAGVLLGNAAVFLFNKMPAKWLTDYGKDPLPELLDPYTQRIKSNPWKFIFSMLFAALGIYLAIKDWRFAIIALVVFWLMTEMAIADYKYRIIPDQFVVMLAISSLGLIGRQRFWPDSVIGAVIGFGIMGLAALLGHLIYKREAVGGGDVKLMAALGFVTGGYGIVAIYILSTIFATIHHIWLVSKKRVKKGASVPFALYAAIACVIYMTFFWGKIQIWML